MMVLLASLIIFPRWTVIHGRGLGFINPNRISRMKAAVVNNLKDAIAIVERNIPTPGYGEVLVKMSASGCCEYRLLVFFLKHDDTLRFCNTNVPTFISPFADRSHRCTCH